MLLCSDGVLHGEYHTTLHCLLHVHAPLTHMHLGARTARSAVKLENAHTLSAALPMYACLLVATLHLRARGQARANVCRAL